VRRGFAVAAAIAFVVLVVACGGDDASSPATPSDAGSRTDGASSGVADSGDSSAPKPNADAGADADAGNACHDVMQEGPYVAGTKKSLPVPTATGGAIASGKYLLSAVNYYSDSDGGGGISGMASTLVVTGNIFDVVTSSTPQGGSTFRARSTFTTNGNELTGTFVCNDPPVDGGSDPVTQEYSATASELRTYLDLGSLGGVFEYIYTKQ
jgi:hypothetical protein